MKKFTMFSNYLFLLMAASILGLTACGDDPILNNEIPPSVTITADAEAAPGGTITLNIVGAIGDADMDLLTITENGANVDLSRISSTDIGANPALLAGDNSSAFAFIVDVEAPVAPATYTYTATVRDANGNTNESSVDVTINSAPPTIMYTGQSIIEIVPNSSVNARITGTPGSANLVSIAVYEDGVLIDDLTRLEFNEVAFDENPYLLEADDQSGFDMAGVLVRYSETSGASNLTFEIEDTNGETAATELTVLVGTAITNTYRDSLLSNADGPVEVLGGINLYTGENVSVNSPTANLIDLGIVSNSDPTWRRQITGANGTTLRAANPASMEFLDFETVNSREAIVAAYDEGIDANPSEVVVVDNIFIANRDNDYFMIKITQVVETNNDNRDFYLLDIKTSEQ